MKSYTTKRLCRAGILAALYMALTYIFAPLAFGPLQVRPAEALCLLALLYPEAIPALTVGCALSNLSSPYAFYDVLVGSLTTAFSSLLSYLIGAKLKNLPLKLFIGGIFPVLCNALILPLVIVWVGGAGGWTLYGLSCLSLLLTQSVWVWGLGIPLYLYITRLKRRGISFFQNH